MFDSPNRSVILGAMLSLPLIQGCMAFCSPSFLFGVEAVVFNLGVPPCSGDEVGLSWDGETNVPAEQFQEVQHRLEQLEADPSYETYWNLVDFLEDQESEYAVPEPTIDIHVQQSCARDRSDSQEHYSWEESGFEYDTWSFNFENHFCVEAVSFDVVEERLPRGLGTFSFTVDNPVSSESALDPGDLTQGEFLHLVDGETDSAVLAVLFDTVVGECE